MQEREQTWLDLVRGDTVTGEVELVFHEESDAWVESKHEPFWLKDGGEFLWTSERTGAWQIHRFDRSGKELAPITQSPTVVDKILRVNEEAGTLDFEGSRVDGILETHVYRAKLDGSGMTQVTREPGTHDVDMAPNGPLAIDKFSSIQEPRAMRVLDFDAENLITREIAASDKSLLAQHDSIMPEFYQVQTRDGFTMEAMVYKPTGFTEGTKYPVVQFTYSGPHAPMVRNRWTGRNHLWHGMMAHRGYVVFVCDNRSASGKGRDFAKAAWRNMGVSELQDLEDGVAWLKDQGWADPARIGLWGWSYGGYQTLYNMTHSETWSCGVAVNPVTDWSLYDTIYTERYMGLPQTNAEGYSRGSVLESAGNLHGKLLLVAATMDDNVHMQNSMQFVHALQMADKQFEFMPYPRVRHGINSRQQMHLFEMMTRFFERNLGGQ